MENPFFNQPVLNSPYEYPSRHWELDDGGQQYDLTAIVNEVRRQVDDRKEDERNREAARLWISGLETVQRQLGLNRVFDLSATPFFLHGSGYAESTLFPWIEISTIIVCTYSAYSEQEARREEP